MPCSLIQTRLALARSWFGIGEPLGRDKMCVLCNEDVEEHVPPLDTTEGARWLPHFKDKLGGFDHVTFDNRACLAIGDQAGDDASTQALKSLQRQISKLNTGQPWLHHAGYDISRG